MSSEYDNSQDYTTDESSSSENELAQMVVDELSDDSQRITNELVNRIILYEPDHHLEEITTTTAAVFWFMYILFCFGIGQFYCLFLFVPIFIIIHQLLSWNHRSDQIFPVDQTNKSKIEFSHIMDANRDAQIESRLAHPTDESLPYSSSVEIVTVGPLNVQNMGTDPEDIHNDAPNILLMNAAGNNENGNNVLLTTRTELDNPMVDAEYHAAEAAVDNPNCNINPISSVQSQDDINSSESSDENSIISSESGFDGDDEGGSSDDQEQTAGETSILTNNPPTNVRKDACSTQTDHGSEQLRVPASPNDVREIMGNVTNPLEGNEEMVRETNQPLMMPIPKPPTDVSSTDSVGEEITN
ncbi:hypothetical protein I4U23_013502 [Adineta vaga]|nr:hypothetical protein I4U23_013502 [Adineta vaga]